MADNFVNPCGGLRWSIDPDGMIQVEGEGYPTVDPTSTAYTYMMQTWQNFGDLLQAAATKYNLPPSWLLAVACMETGFLSADPAKQAAAQSPVGAIGVMQIMPFNATAFGLSSSDDLYDPANNVDVGAQILAKDNASGTAGGLPGISALYNSGKLCTTDASRNEWMLLADADYPRHVIEWNNAALQAGIIYPLGSSTFALLGAAMGAALGLAVAVHHRS